MRFDIEGQGFDSPPNEADQAEERALDEAARAKRPAVEPDAADGEVQS